MNIQQSNGETMHHIERYTLSMQTQIYQFSNNMQPSLITIII